VNWETSTPEDLASHFDNEHQALAVHKADTEREIVRNYSQLVKPASPSYVMDFARSLLFRHGLRWQAYEVIASHKMAFRSLDAGLLEQLGQGIDSWWATDSFARTLSGPAWKERLVSDELIAGWATSPDLWWRRAALVSTVAFNVHSQGGTGDVPRTLAICQMLAADHTDMVVKALSWALRELVYFDPQAVKKFLEQYDDVLASRVKREVGNKLRTGLKYKRKN
jgi:3-methyladenine DNA glycosylase AlkD